MEPEDFKSFSVFVGDKYVDDKLVHRGETVGEIKKYMNELANRENKKEYKPHIYLDEKTRIDVTETTDYDNETLYQAWDEITAGSLYLLPPNYLRKLPIDILRKTYMKLDDKDLFNACSSSKYINDRVCKENTFWINRIRLTFPKIKPKNIRDEVKK